MPESIKLAVFDCDGTLVDSQHAINACMADAFAAAGLPPPALGAVRRVVGLPLFLAIQTLVDDANAPVASMVEAYSASWRNLRETAGLDEPLFAGTRETLDRLDAGGWLLGVATGKSHRGLSETLRLHDLTHRFVTLQTSDRARGKPHPEMLHLAMRETGADPGSTVMIGDTTYDMEMARAAKVRAVGVAWGYHEPDELLAAGAERVVHTVAELADAITDAREAQT